MQTTNAGPFWGIVLVVLAIGLGGCATLFTRPSQHVPIDSIPPAAQVFVDGTFVGTTPITIELEKRTEHEVLLRLGDQEQSVTLRSGIDGAYVALDVAPGLVTAGASALVFATTDFSNTRGLGWAVPGIASIGIVVGLGSAVINVAVDAGTGRWYRLTPGEVLVVFD